MRKIPARTAACVSILLLALPASSARDAVAQTHWSPKVAAGLSAWFTNESGDAGLGPIARVQLLRSTEGSFAWGPEVAFSSVGTFGGSSCADPSCTESSGPDTYSVRVLDLGLSARLGSRGGREGVYGTAGLAWSQAWEEWRRAVDRKYGGLGASLGIGYALPRERPGIFFELRGHVLAVADDESVGGGIYAALVAGLSF